MRPTAFLGACLVLVAGAPPVSPRRAPTPGGDGRPDGAGFDAGAALLAVGVLALLGGRRLVS
jgi:hypothetical protein